MSGHNFESMNDNDLIDLLLKDDPQAWDYVILELITPLCRAQKYLSLCSKYSISPDSLVTQVWMVLRNNDFRKLRLFRFGASFTTYLYIIVREAHRYEIKENVGKIPYELSEDDDFCSQIADREKSDSAELKDEMRYANELLARLWDDNPQQAWVLLMRNSLKLSAKDVATFLNESSENVDQMNSRAKSKMKQMRKNK